MSDMIFRYEYRDGANYKQAGAIRFPDPDGLGEVAGVLRLVAACNLGEDFVAEQVRVPEVFFSGEDEDDHGWHTFDALEIDTGEPSLLLDGEPDEHGRTLLQFVEEVERASGEGWKPVFRGSTEELLNVVYGIAGTYLSDEQKERFKAQVRERTGR